ncbi:MAG: low molecular weight phosphotyrosine protein phosphatase [Burkholderiales bacterium]|nr:low molecular weight phosphotyrosine protein phosphatase [Burkholderiales bacterium]
MNGKKKVSVLFVCMGNICRSPTAEAVFRAHLEEAGLHHHVEVDSAGTHDYHIGQPPDARARAAGLRRGYRMDHLRGRQVSERDFERFDYVLAMDMDNLEHLVRLCPQTHAHKLSLFMEYARNFREREVPDPYYGGPAGFEQVLDMVEDASRGLLEHIRRRHFGPGRRGEEQ